jgi:hypothetical protein
VDLQRDRINELYALAEDLERGRQAVLALRPKPLVVQPFHGAVERPQLVAAAVRDAQRVEDRLGPVSAQGDRVVVSSISRSSIASATGRAPSAPLAPGSCAAFTLRFSAISVAARWSSGYRWPATSNTTCTRLSLAPPG